MYENVAKIHRKCEKKFAASRKLLAGVDLSGMARPLRLLEIG
jgi:hypothetical protein